MGVGEVDGPPKKRLKQAQLPFCISSAEKSGNKRKLDSVSPDSGLALKVSRKDSTPRALTFDKENFKVNNVDNDVETVELLSDSDESNGIPKPANQTTVKESTTKRLDDKASEDDNAKEGVGNQVGSNLNREGEPEVDDDVITESKKTDDAGDNGGQVTDEGPGQNENAGKGESVVEKADGKINVDVPEQTEESAQEKVVHEEGAAVVESKVVCDDDKESKTASEAKETSDLDKTSDKTLESNQVETDLDRSIESEQGDPNSSLVVSSEDENNVSVSSAKKGSGATPVLRKADRAKRREEKMRLKKEKEELRRQKQEKKEKRERLKEEERKKKEDERKRKEEEKRKKEEVKEEEKRKKEEEKK